MSSPLSALCAILRGDTRELPPGSDGAALRDLAVEHRVDRLVAWRTGAVDADVRREAVLEEIRLRELNRVVAAFDARGLQPVVFKGAALAHTHYAASWLRPRVDGDVLVQPERRAEAGEILEALGYARKPLVSGELVMSQATFRRVDRLGLEHVVDLHWHVANPQAVKEVCGHAELVRDGRRVTVLGQAMRVPSAVQALLLACVHRAAHHDDSDELLWLHDIHLVAASLDGRAWASFTDLAARRGVRALCARGLALAAARLRTVVPAEVTRRLAEGDADSEPAAVFLRSDLRPLDRLRADLRMLDLRSRARLLREHLFPPPAYMRCRYGIGRHALLPAYYLRRVLAGAPAWLTRLPRRDDQASAAR